MGLMPNSMDGKGISESIAVIIDKIKYRKYADDKYTTVIFINKENTLVKILDGSIKDGTLYIPALDLKKMVDKIYILPSKKIVTRVCFVKEDINTTLDILITDTSKVSAEMFKKFVGIKLLEDLQSFNIGQVLLGAAIGTILGIVISLGVLMIYAAFL